MGSTPVGGSENSFPEYFDLRTRPHYLHFIQVTNHLTFVGLSDWSIYVKVFLHHSVQRWPDMTYFIMDG